MVDLELHVLITPELGDLNGTFVAALVSFQIFFASLVIQQGEDLGTQPTVKGWVTLPSARVAVMLTTVPFATPLPTEIRKGAELPPLSILRVGGTMTFGFDDVRRIVSPDGPASPRNVSWPAPPLSLCRQVSP
jgi:hypothetical protein